MGLILKARMLLRGGATRQEIRHRFSKGTLETACQMEEARTELRRNPVVVTMNKVGKPFTMAWPIPE